MEKDISEMTKVEIEDTQMNLQKEYEDMLSRHNIAEQEKLAIEKELLILKTQIDELELMRSKLKEKHKDIQGMVKKAEHNIKQKQSEIKRTDKMYWRIIGK